MSDNEHYRHVMLFYFRKGKSAAEISRKLNSVYGENSVSERTCQKWVKRFRSGDFSLSDATRSGRPKEVDSEAVRALIESNPRQNVRELAERLAVSKSTIQVELRKLGFVSKLDYWVPHTLTEASRLSRIDVCDTLRIRQRNSPFLKFTITGDEKWILYENVTRKRSWGKSNEPPQTTSKGGLHPSKVLLSVFWDFKGIVHYELLPRNQTITAEFYIAQLERLKGALEEKRPGLINRHAIVFHHDNARPHTAIRTRQKLLELGWEVLPHPPYSPDLAPSDFHLFRSLDTSLRGKKFQNDTEVKNHLDRFFREKPKEFYTRGIMKLIDRWSEVIRKNGDYIMD